MKTTKPDPEPPTASFTEAEIVAATAKNILEKLAAGGIPTAREMDILREMNAKSPRPEKYQFRHAVYASRYAVDERTIRRYAAEGRPLDDEAAMRELISPRGRKKPPSPEMAAQLAPAMDAEISPVTLDESFFEASGVLAAIERLERAERERAGAYFLAISKRQVTAVVQNRFKEWMGIVEALRKLALDAPEIRKANDLTVDRTEIEAGIGHIFASFRAAARGLPTRAAAKLLAARTREEFVTVLEAEIEVLLRTLTEISVASAANADLAASVQAEALAVAEENPASDAAEEPPKKPRRRARKKRAAKP